MEILPSSNSSATSPFRRGCNPILATQRSKMQSRRSRINHQLYKQMRMRNGAENLLNATNNPKVKETVALELSFVNSNLQLLKEELSDINSTVEPYQNKSAKATSIPMLSVGLKDTTDLNLMEPLENIISEHYREDPMIYEDELADLVDMRTAVRTPARTLEGISLLLEYYNQLYFIENRFFSSSKPSAIFFHWYDCITGEPSVERSVSLEKVSILFNVGALYSQIGTRADRSRKKEIETAIDAYQRSAGVYSYLKANYRSAPTVDLSLPFLNALADLMLAQAQECQLEHKILGGFEIELGKCATIAREAMKVSEKYGVAERSLTVESLRSYVPFPWVSMVQVKMHHYQALSHYYAGIGLLEQHEAAEPLEIANLLSTLYLENQVADVPKPDAAARKKDDRRRLGKSHLRHAVFCHERALQTHSLCKMQRTTDVLKEYLQHAHVRSVEKFEQADAVKDFFELLDTPSIQAYTDTNVESLPPLFESVPSTDLFRKLGPLSIFSIHNKFTSPRDVILTNETTVLGFAFSGDSPITVCNLDDDSIKLGMQNDDVVIAVDGIDVKWRHHAYVYDYLYSRRGVAVTLKMVTVTVPVSTTPTNAVSNGHIPDTTVPEKNFENGHGAGSNPGKVVMRGHSLSKPLNGQRKRNSFAFLNSLKRRPKPNRFSTLAQSSSLHSAPGASSAISLQQNPPPPISFVHSSATVLRKKKEIAEQSTDL